MLLAKHAQDLKIVAAKVAQRAFIYLPQVLVLYVMIIAEIVLMVEMKTAKNVKMDTTYNCLQLVLFKKVMVFFLSKRY